MTQSERIAHGHFRFFLKSPGFFSVKLAAGAVKPHDRRECAKLRPASHHLIVFVAQHMTADVVAPPAIADIGCGFCKIGLEIQRLPGCHRIPGKTDRITMTARSCIAGEGHRPLAFSLTVEEMKMIKDPQRIQTFYLTVSSLLPVDPPEVHAFFFTGVMKIFEVRFHKLRVSRITAHRILCLVIHAHGFCHFYIHFLMSLNTVCRMHI